MLFSKCDASFAVSFCESKIVASYPSSIARALAVSPSTTNHGLFSVEITTAIFSFGADCADEICVNRIAAVVTRTASASLSQLVFIIWFRVFCLVAVRMLQHSFHSLLPAVVKFFYFGGLHQRTE